MVWCLDGPQTSEYILSPIFLAHSLDSFGSGTRAILAWIHAFQVKVLSDRLTSKPEIICWSNNCFIDFWEIWLSRLCISAAGKVGQAVIYLLSQSRQYPWNLGALSNVLPLTSLMMHFCCANMVWKPASSHLPIEIRVKAISGAYRVSLNMTLVSLPWILVGITSIPISRASKVPLSAVRIFLGLENSE